MIRVPFPKEGEYSPYALAYYNMLNGADPIQSMTERLDTTEALWRAIPEEQGEYRYAEGKWTIKQVIGHVTDVERIFGYRALSIVRGESVNLPGFEEDEYEAAAKHNNRSLGNIIDEWVLLRKANIVLFSTFTAHDFTVVGKANNHPTSVAAVIYGLAGHEIHHTNVLQQRYGI